MNDYTLTYSEGVQGFPSFYSYLPDWMIGMNNYFYTFKGGNLYRHNVNETRNNFYGQQYQSKITSVFNDGPLENKLFKTINLEGDDNWGLTMYSDIQDGGFIQSDWFEKKENVWYGFVRNSGSVPAGIDEYALRSLNGIGVSTSVANGTTISFDLSYKIKNILSVGDMIYFAEAPNYNLPKLGGQVTEINVDLLNGINNIVIDDTVAGAQPISAQDGFFFFIKNSVAESHGILGHYSVFNITNTNTNKINLFAVESEIMKSYP